MPTQISVTVDPAHNACPTSALWHWCIVLRNFCTPIYRQCTSKHARPISTVLELGCTRCLLTASSWGPESGENSKQQQTHFVKCHTQLSCQKKRAAYQRAVLSTFLHSVKLTARTAADTHCTQLRFQESAPWQSDGMRLAKCAHPRGRSFYSAQRNRPRSRRRSAGGCGRPEQARGRSPGTGTRDRGRRACLCRISRRPPPPRPALMHCFLGTTATSVTVGYT